MKEAIKTSIQNRMNMIDRSVLESLGRKHGFTPQAILGFIILHHSGTIKTFSLDYVLRSFAELKELFMMIPRGSICHKQLSLKVDEELDTLLNRCSKPDDYIFLWTVVSEGKKAEVSHAAYFASERFDGFMSSIGHMQVSAFMEMSRNIPEFFDKVEERCFHIEALRASMLFDLGKSGIFD